MRIGIYGGSFNPPHNMHLKMVSELLTRKLVDKVIFVPTGNKYPKTNLVSGMDRIKMINLMIEGNPNLEVSDYELKESQVYTYKTLNYFKNCYSDSEIYFILGSDLLKDFKTWKNYEYILANFKILVTLRDTDKKEDLEKLELSNSENIIYTNIKLSNLSSTKIREKIVNKDKYYLFFDEIQNVEHWEKAINSFKASQNVSIFITGSNSDLLSGELATHIAGRYVSFKTYPFTFKEVCELKNITDRKDIEEAFDDYVIWGRNATKIYANR